MGVSYQTVLFLFVVTSYVRAAGIAAPPCPFALAERAVSDQQARVITMRDDTNSTDMIFSALDDIRDDPPTEAVQEMFRIDATLLSLDAAASPTQRRSSVRLDDTRLNLRNRRHALHHEARIWWLEMVPELLDLPSWPHFEIQDGILSEIRFALGDGPTGHSLRDLERAVADWIRLGVFERLPIRRICIESTRPSPTLIKILERASLAAPHLEFKLTLRQASPGFAETLLQSKVRQRVTALELDATLPRVVTRFFSAADGLAMPLRELVLQDSITSLEMESQIAASKSVENVTHLAVEFQEHYAGRGLYFFSPRSRMKNLRWLELNTLGATTDLAAAISGSPLLRNVRHFGLTISEDYDPDETELAVDSLTIFFNPGDQFPELKSVRLQLPDLEVPAGFLNSPRWNTVEELTVENSGDGLVGTRLFRPGTRFARSKALRRITANNLSSEEIDGLARCFFLPRLTDVDLTLNQVGLFVENSAIKNFLRLPLHQLRELRLTGDFFADPLLLNLVGKRGIKIDMPELRWVTWHSRRFTGQDFRSAFAAPKR